MPAQPPVTHFSDNTADGIRIARTHHTIGGYLPITNLHFLQYSNTFSWREDIWSDEIFTKIIHFKAEQWNNKVTWSQNRNKSVLHYHIKNDFYRKISCLHWENEEMLKATINLHSWNFFLPPYKLFMKPHGHCLHAKTAFKIFVVHVPKESLVCESDCGNYF